MGLEQQKFSFTSVLSFRSHSFFIKAKKHAADASSSHQAAPASRPEKAAGMWLASAAAVGFLLNFLFLFVSRQKEKEKKYIYVIPSVSILSMFRSLPLEPTQRTVYH